MPVKKILLLHVLGHAILNINIISKHDEGGYLLTWDIDFEKLPDDRWKLFVDFRSRGEIEVVCNDIAV